MPQHKGQMIKKIGAKAQDLNKFARSNDGQMIFTKGKKAGSEFITAAKKAGGVGKLVKSQGFKDRVRKDAERVVQGAVSGGFKGKTFKGIAQGAARGGLQAY